MIVLETTWFPEQRQSSSDFLCRIPDLAYLSKQSTLNDNFRSDTDLCF